MREEEKEEHFWMKAYHKQERRRKADVKVKPSSAWNYYWSTFFVICFLGRGSALTPEDCQEIDLKTFSKPEISFDESLFFTILANQKDSWNFSATISDLKGVKCSFGVWRHNRKRNEYLRCPETGHNFSGSTDEKSQEHISEKTEVSLDVDRRLSCLLLQGESTTSCGHNVRITWPQLLVVTGYNPKWIQTLLEPPMKMTVDNMSGAKMTVNCKNIDCLQTSGMLKENIAYKRNVFFLKPADSFQGITISAGCNVLVNRSSLQVYNESWFNITLERDDNAVKVLVDGRESYKKPCTGNDFWIKSVQLTGGGLLTWCGPRDVRKVSDLDPKMVAIFALVALLVAIVVMFGIITCCAKRRPSSAVQEEVTTTPSTSLAANHHQLTNSYQGRQHESAVYEYVETGAFVNVLTRHDSENSLYGESNFQLKPT